MLDLSEGHKLGLDISNRVLEEIRNSKDEYGATVNIIFNQYKDANLATTI